MDIGQIRNVQSAEDCQAECRQREDCGFWTWNSGEFSPKPNTCYLKSSDLVQVPGVGKVSGPRECQVRARRQAGPEKCYEEGVNYAGHGILNNRVDNVASPRACQEACLMRLGCQVSLAVIGYSPQYSALIGQHWTWNNQTSVRFPATCWLKSKSAREGRREGVVNKVRPIIWLSSLIEITSTRTFLLTSLFY